MKSRGSLGRFAALALLGCVALAAGASPHFEQAVVSDRKGGEPMSTFAPDTAKIFLGGKLVEMKAGSTVKTTWIAEKTDVAPPNYVINAYEGKAGAGTSSASFSMSRPTKGWPTGLYRVEVSIDGQTVHRQPFSIESR